MDIIDFFGESNPSIYTTEMNLVRCKTTFNEKN